MSDQQPPIEPDDDDEELSRGKSLCMLGVVVAGLSMMSLPLSGLYLIFDMASHFAMHFMIAGGAFLAGFFMPKWNLRTAIVLTIIGVVGIGFVAKRAPPLNSASVTAPQGTKALKLMTFNTWLSNKNWQGIVDEITRQRP